MITENVKTFTAAAALARRVLVKLSAARTVVVNTASDSDDPIGITEYAVSAAEEVAVRLLNSAGTVELTAAGAITVNADVYAAADGEIQALPADAGDYRKIGVALEAATAEGDIIEILPYDFTTVTTVA